MSNKVIGTILLVALSMTMSVIVWFAYTEAETMLDYVVLAAFALANACVMYMACDACFRSPKI